GRWCDGACGCAGETQWRADRPADDAWWGMIGGGFSRLLAERLPPRQLGARFCRPHPDLRVVFGRVKIEPGLPLRARRGQLLADALRELHHLVDPRPFV